ncbi:hypothetical protein p2A77 (plasmid) [Aromatoleum aromaticum EbN1]|uniref:Uncharacterized protein n=1 Tax=Aromatoleum aromaticum (strain DSM 19018 / LMG 30748 / EbN1) TaxID=76114 RepID=Q5NWJ5_AROAE|nr:hypothetical protein p2A77 [Aromatoleum aromaticum EbN1]
MSDRSGSRPSCASRAAPDIAASSNREGRGREELDTPPLAVGVSGHHFATHGAGLEHHRSRSRLQRLGNFTERLVDANQVQMEDRLRVSDPVSKLPPLPELLVEGRPLR